MNTNPVNMEPYANFTKRNFFTPRMVTLSSKNKRTRASLSLSIEDENTEATLKKRCCFETEPTALALFYNRINDQILTEILIRLPPECSSRYKTVCKHWCSLLSSPYFITRVINLGRQYSFTLVFQYEITSTEHRYKYLSYFQAISNHLVLSKEQNVDLRYLPRHSLSDAYYAQDTNIKEVIDILRKCDDHFHRMTIMGSCNDLLLCSHHGLYRFYVVNLLTRRWIMLPPSGPENTDTISDELGEDAFAGLLCYNDRFKVVVFPAYNEFFKEDCFFNPELCQFRLRIYCSESNQWTDFVVDWYPFAWTPVSYRDNNPILAHGGMLHWLNGCSLVSFNPFIDSGQDLKLSHTIKLPDELVHHWPSCFGLCRGHFRVARKFLDKDRTYFHVWELDDYDKGVWKLVHKLLLDISDLTYGIANREHPIHFMAFHPFDEDIIFVRVQSFVYKFNLRTRGFQRYCKLKRSIGDYGLCKAVPPLLHQWFPTAIPSPPPLT